MRLDRDSNFRFGVYEIDFGTGEIRKAGKPLSVEPQVFVQIVLLASRAGDLVSRDEIIEAVWAGRIISESAIATRINAARAALVDDGKAQKVIQTVRRRGFRFVGVEPTPDLTLPDRPSIAVLPFENMAGDPEQEFFSDGITDDIVTELARYDELFVTARNSSFAYKNQRVAVSEIARELGVQYVLEGGVRRAGGRVRVTAGRLCHPHGGPTGMCDGGA
jgi:TolB-like protein